jgi:hypothetical protein
MALSRDTSVSTTNTTNQTTGGTTTLSMTLGGSADVLYVEISFWNNGGAAAGCSGVTWNSSAMTFVGGTNSVNGTTGHFRTEFWRIVAPTTGTHNIIATVGGQCDKLGIAATSLIGADQTTPTDTFATAFGTTGSVTTTISTTVSNTIMLDGVCHLSANTASANSGTSVYNDGAVGAGVAAQYGTAVSNGTNNMTWTYPDPGDEWAYMVLAVRPSTGGGGGGSTTGSFFF